MSHAVYISIICICCLSTWFLTKSNRNAELAIDDQEYLIPSLQTDHLQLVNALKKAQNKIEQLESQCPHKKPNQALANMSGTPVLNNTQIGDLQPETRTVIDIQGFRAKSLQLESERTAVELQLLTQFKQGVNNEEALALAKQMREVSEDMLAPAVVEQLLVGIELYNTGQQLDALDLLEGSVRQADLPLIYPLLLNPDTQVQEEALLRLQELKPSHDAIYYLETFAAQTQDKWALKAAQQLLLGARQAI